MRGLAALALLAAIVPPLRSLDWTELARIAILVLVLAGLYVLLALGLQRLDVKLHPWAGAFGALVPLATVYLTLGSVGQLAGLTFLIVSLAIAALRADSGCEVMALPGLLFGRRTHLVCILFSPIDWLERRQTAVGSSHLRRPK